ncbi:MAG: hypothetical protein ABIO86_03620 [Sphingomonas sp.]
MKRLHYWAIAAAFGLTASPALAQYGLADGGFDTQGGSVSSYCYFPNCPSGAWSGTAGFIHSGSTDWGNPVAVSPSATSFVQYNQTISQTFTATASGNVRLVWYDQARQGFGGTETYSVTVNGATVATLSPTNATFQRRYSAVFTLTSGSSYTVSFVGQTGGDNSALIDSVDIQPASETITYSYDALGRLTDTAHSGAVTGGLASHYQFDPAGNRTQVTVTGAPQ